MRQDQEALRGDGLQHGLGDLLGGEDGAGGGDDPGADALLALELEAGVQHLGVDPHRA